MMSGESPEVQMARIDERMKHILQQLEKAEVGRKHQYEFNESINAGMQRIDTRLEGVEKSLATQAPTIQEFITIKQQVLGAGMLGRWVWIGLGTVIAFLFNSRTAIIEWLSK